MREILNEPTLYKDHKHFGYFMITKHFCKKSICKC